MASAIHDDELSISLPAYDGSRSRPSLPPVVSPPARAENQTLVAESPDTRRALNRLQQYSFIKNIGEGSFGKVKLAKHKITGQEVAMKTINRRKLISRDMAGRVEREIQYLQLLRHPHIIKLYTVITTKFDIYMVLEYVPQELFDYIVKHGRLSEKKARKLWQQIICAVEYCHRHKIVHRDLKPENLLLDHNSNVKIADFGLSNIMTDGNFLKTSCGSPNYAAPEVIGGKLYAGPEVDVWSCGVILYVFLVGRLPFDDEFIPALFKKIQAGSFHIPSSVPAGAADLIKKCLQVHPVNRITIPEIRQHEWFAVDLPAYLREPAAEFIDTGVDPGKAIDPTQIAPGKPPEVVERIHDEVVGKLGRTLGYNSEDVKDALSKDEPSAIKDAYLIVRENQLMLDARKYDTAEEIALLNSLQAQYNADDPNLESFMASSPPVEPNYPSFRSRSNHSEISPLTPRRPEARQSSGTAASETQPTLKAEVRPRISNVRVLNTSLPPVHEDLLRAREVARSRGEDPDSILHPSQVDYERSGGTTPIPEATLGSDGKPIARTKEEQEATVRALKPHSRSITNFSQLQNQPQGMTSIEKDEKKAAPPKTKPRKWQFGIRSRNLPYEAMKCLFAALKAQGADWEISPASMSDSNYDGEDEKENSPPPPPPELGPGEHYELLQSKYPELPTDYYVPRDPWNIRARFLKKGMLMPGEPPSLSAHSSATSLPAEAQAQLKKHIEELGGYASDEVSRAIGMNSPASRKTPSSNSSTRPTSGLDSSAPPPQANVDVFAGPASSKLSTDSLSNIMHKKETADNVGVWIYMDIQLYTLETNTYVVDFKCDGYQNVVLHDPRQDKNKSGVTTGYNSSMTSPNNSRPTSGFGRMQNGSISNQHRGEDDNVFDDEDMRPYWKPVSKRYRNLEKEITSPYPYLDVASDLVARLWGGIPA